MNSLLDLLTLSLGGYAIDLTPVFAGAAVGFSIGVTGVGGGSLMTPILLLMGYAPAIAIGTDLLYAALTKLGGIAGHHRRGSIDWRIVRSLSLGSLPAALCTHLALHWGWFFETGTDSSLLTGSLGFMLLITASVLLLRSRLRESAEALNPPPLLRALQANKSLATTLMGIVLGVCVTLSSVGAGAFAAALLLIIYADTPSARIVGSDIAHAVPLTLLAGIGYWMADQVDMLLLTGLLVGSLPAIQLGTRVAHRLPERLLRRGLIVLLGILGSVYLMAALR